MAECLHGQQAVTLAGFFRELDASSRRSARAEQRSLRQMAAMRVEASQEEARDLAQAAVCAYDAYLDTLATMHQACSDERDWEHLARQADPPEPTPQTASQQLAKVRAVSYTPSFFDRLLFRARTKQEALYANYRRAVAIENDINAKRLAAWKERLIAVQQVSTIAARVCRRDDTVYGEVLSEMLPLQVLAAIVTDARLHWESLDRIEATICIRDTDVIPDYVLTLTKTGKLSEKAMTQKRYWELYQDVVCAAAIRAAREIFAVLPFREVLIQCEAKRPSPVTGMDETGIALSVRYPREPFSHLVFSRLDPSDSLAAFEHRMQFKRGEGFRFVEPLPR